jgi:transposase-like protein
LRNLQRGARDILIACFDGLSGFPEAIEAIFSTTTVQICIVHYADLRVWAPGLEPTPAKLA